MKIIKTIKCKSCNSIVKGENAKCTCGKIVLSNNKIISESVIENKDYEELTPTLLCE